MTRKNAPETEIGKQKLTEMEKLRNRPQWMTATSHHVRNIDEIRS
jgi:hypothetical protein